MPSNCTVEMVPRLGDATRPCTVDAIDCLNPLAWKADVTAAMLRESPIGTTAAVSAGLAITASVFASTDCLNWFARKPATMAAMLAALLVCTPLSEFSVLKAATNFPTSGFDCISAVAPALGVLLSRSVMLAPDRVAGSRLNAPSATVSSFGSATRPATEVTLPIRL